MGERQICALLFGEAETEKKAKNTAGTFEDCPYINLIATKENRLFATFFLPERPRWWIESVEKHRRQILGLIRVEVVFVDEVQYPKHLTK